MQLKDKVCLITGAGKGIGRAIAVTFAREGARLVLVSRTAADLAALAKALEKESGVRPLTLAADASREAAARRAVQAALKRWGGVDVLVNNAGMRFRKKAEAISKADWTAVLDNNLTSAFLFSREVGRLAIGQKRPAQIVNMASVVGDRGLPELAAYAASKGGMIALTRSLAVEWAEHKIRVNAIAPGFCETSFARRFKKKQRLYRMTLSKTPLGRWGKSQEVADAALFLAGTSSSYITGEVLHVDGGWCAW